MPLKVQNSRLLLKRTMTGGTPTVNTTSVDFTDRSWGTNEIYAGEMFWDMLDKKLYLGWDDGITVGVSELLTSASSASTTDIYVTGGTYNNGTGTATFTNTTGGTFNVTGFTTGGTSTSDLSSVLSIGNTTSGNNIIISSGDSINQLSATGSTIAICDSSKNLESADIKSRIFYYN